ncbi:uncharacterized protein LOC103318053 [Nasonia vitripennis]|uniref:Uncharacterized protein n=1 Tax=Nasonia vitripennis TaxID=7425 RepID=A0A7M7LVE7_NASVI|nr:uncharacterized protein LOC103318053 [Nasonia vitripennis]
MDPESRKLWKTELSEKDQEFVPEVDEPECETRQIALGSLQSLHCRFSRDPKVAHAYQEFLKVYEDLGHMVRVSESEIRREGAPLQSDLELILLNWRRYLFAFTADIVKMFRQIKVQREDQDFQRIVWVPIADSPPVDFRLTTVTYGTASTPFLAIRTLQQLVEDEGARFSLGAECLKPRRM